VDGAYVVPSTPSDNYSFTGLLVSRCSNSHFRAFIAKASTGIKVTNSYDNFLDVDTYQDQAYGIYFEGSNSNTVSLREAVGTSTSDSLGIVFDTYSVANVITGGEIAGWASGVVNLGRANKLDGVFIENNTTAGVVAHAGSSMAISGSNDANVMEIDSGAIVDSAVSYSLSPNQPNSRANDYLLSAYYPLVEGSGTTIHDWSINSRDASIQSSGGQISAITWLAGGGPYGAALSIPGASPPATYISIPTSAIDYTKPFTVAILLRAGMSDGTFSGTATFFAVGDASGNTISLRMGPTGSALVQYYRNGTFVANMTNEIWTTTKWLWALVAFDPVRGTIQSINPARPGTAVTTTTPLTGSPAFIRLQSDGGSWRLGSFAIWQRVLGFDEVQAWITQPTVFSAAMVRRLAGY
jgi:parallel beta-helix repeat protein